MTIHVDIEIDIDAVPCQVDYAASGQYVASNDELRVAAAGATDEEAVANFRDALATLIRHEVEAGRAIPEALAPYIRVPA